MDSREISLWLDRRWLEALNRQYPDGGLQKKLEDYVEVLTCQLPKEVQEQIRGEIQAEDRLAQERHEASRRFAVFCVRQDGKEEDFLSEGRMEFHQAAYKLWQYLREGSGQRFADTLPNRSEISAEQYVQYALERRDNTGRVTGMFDINLDKGEFSAMHIMDGWKTFRVKDVATAAYHAMRKGHLPEEKRLEIFLDRLDGKEITGPVAGSVSLPVERISFSEEISEIEDKLNFYINTDFDVDAVFGTHVCTDENDDTLNVYANYDIKNGSVCDTLDIVLQYGDGHDEDLSYLLSESERAVLLQKMDSYCKSQTGMSLEDYRAQLLEESAESLQMEDLAGPQMQM